jgi:glycosyltransferase involved in cell wall biosynthesis
MRILFVTNNLSLGGKERQIVELLNYLSENSSHVYGLCMKEDVIQYNLNKANNIKIYKPKEKLGIIKLVLFHKTVINHFSPDIIHTWEGSVALTISLLKMIYKTKYAIIDGTLRHSKRFMKTSKAYWIFRFNRTIAKKVIANSKAGLISINKQNDPKYMVIPNGINMDRFQNYNKKNSSNITNIGMVANFIKAKDYKTLINVGLKLIDENVKIIFTFIGDGPEKKDLEAIIPFRYKEHFKFIGHTDNPEIYIKDFSIGVLLSKKEHSEGMSNAIMEYMAFKLPVICTNTGGNKELITNDYNGYLVNHEGNDQLEETLKKLIMDKELRISFGNRSLKTLQCNYDISSIANKYIDLYKLILKCN